MDILRAQKQAKDLWLSKTGNQVVRFALSTSVLCEWLDPYFGLFIIAGKKSEGFISVNDLPDDIEVTHQWIV